MFIFFLSWRCAKLNEESRPSVLFWKRLESGVGGERVKLAEKESKRWGES